MTELDYAPAPLNSRFQTYPLPVSAPGNCAVCGAVDRPVVDFGMTIQFFGAVMICVMCMREASRLVGMVPSSELLTAEHNLTQSFEKQLDDKDLVAIPSERYHAIALALGGVLDLVLPLHTGNNDLVAAETKQDEPSLFDNIAESGSWPDGTFEQEHDVVVSKGRDDVSGRNGNGNTGLQL